MRAILRAEGTASLVPRLLILIGLSGIATPAAAQDVVAPTVEQSSNIANARPDNGAPSAQKPARQYFIDFRSRSAVSYGHTFVVHGRVGSKLTASHVAGLHPMSESSIIYMLGHILPVPSETGASDGDLEREYLTASYRILLSEPQYRALVANIKKLQANSPVWNAAAYNCNAFAADIAHFLGLETPHIWTLPKNFINTLRELNTPRRHAAATSHL
jgi:hypothetical protein